MNTTHQLQTNNLRPAELWATAHECIRLLALRESAKPQAMLEVIDELREMAHAEIDRDLVEVREGVTLPSLEAAQSVARYDDGSQLALDKLTSWWQRGLISLDQYREHCAQIALGRFEMPTAVGGSK